MKAPLIPAQQHPLVLLKFFHKQKRLTDCLELLTQCGFQGDEAIFILSNMGGRC
jgi:hypothetical protein